MTSTDGWLGRESLANLATLSLAIFYDGTAKRGQGKAVSGGRVAVNGSGLKA